MSTYRVEVYDGSTRPSPRPYEVVRVKSLRAAHKEAARMLGAKNLRGAASWPYYERGEEGTAYQFGPRNEDNGYDFAVIVEL